MPKSAFVSYSRTDQGLIEPIVAILRVTFDAVFQDITGIKPGKKWRIEVESAVRATDLVVLFWCIHSSRSREVKWEYELALEAAKDIVPICLDWTAMPAELAQFHRVDFRNLGRTTHSGLATWTPVIRRSLRMLQSIFLKEYPWWLACVLLTLLAWVMLPVRVRWLALLPVPVLALFKTPLFMRVARKVRRYHFPGDDAHFSSGGDGSISSALQHRDLHFDTDVDSPIDSDDVAREAHWSYWPRTTRQDIALNLAVELCSRGFVVRS